MVAWQGGVTIKETGLYFDAPHHQHVCFVSRATVPFEWPRNGRVRVIATAETLRLRAAIFPREPLGEELPVQRGRPFYLGKLRLEVIDGAGFPGAAQLLVEDGKRRVLYAGRVEPRAGEEITVRGADELVLVEPRRPLQLLRAAIEAAVAGDDAVSLVVSDVERAYEAAALLDAHGEPFALPAVLKRLTALAPVDFARQHVAKRGTKPRIQLALGKATGRPVDVDALWASIPRRNEWLRPHIAFIRAVGAERVYIAGPAGDLAARLQRENIPFSLLGPPEQTSLSV